MIREILKMGDERLLRIAPPVPAEMFDSPELWQLIDDMFQTMESVGGVGLAAPQIGVDLQLVIFGFEHSERYPDAEAVPQTILINPLITPLSPVARRGIRRLPVGTRPARRGGSLPADSLRRCRSQGRSRFCASPKGSMRGWCSMNAIT